VAALDVTPHGRPPANRRGYTGADIEAAGPNPLNTVRWTSAFEGTATTHRLLPAKSFILPHASANISNGLSGRDAIDPQRTSPASPHCNAAIACEGR
jgi:hypothetical protein